MSQPRSPVAIEGLSNGHLTPAAKVLWAGVTGSIRLVSGCRRPTGCCNSLHLREAARMNSWWRQPCGCGYRVFAAQCIYSDELMFCYCHPVPYTWHIAHHPSPRAMTGSDHPVLGFLSLQPTWSAYHPEALQWLLSCNIESLTFAISKYVY